MKKTAFQGYFAEPMLFGYPWGYVLDGENYNADEATLRLFDSHDGYSAAAFVEIVKARFIAQAKQHQVELLRSRHDTYIDIVTKAGNGVTVRDYATHMAAECNGAISELEGKVDE